jgi:hypothetical protein
VQITEGEAAWEQLHRQHQGTEAALEALGVEVRGAMSVAEQRALRMYLHLHGQAAPRRMEALNVRDPKLLLMLTAVWTDALGVGLAGLPDAPHARTLGLAQLSEAVRNTDARSEEGTATAQMLAALGLHDVDAVTAMAMTRSQRIITVSPTSEMQRKRGTPTVLTSAAGMWIDGVAAGLTATALARQHPRTGHDAQPPAEEM